MLYNNLPALPNATISLGTAGGVETLVANGTGPGFTLKGLTAGAGISLSSDATSVTITNSSPASSVTLGNVGAGFGLVSDGTGPSLTTKSLLGGTGISITDSGGVDALITNSSPATSVTLSSVGAGVSVVDDGTGPALATRSMVASTGMAIANVGQTVTFAVNGGPGFLAYSFDTATVNGPTSSLLWTSPALADGTYALTCHCSARPTFSNGISAYRLIATAWVSGGVLVLRGSGISDNMGGAFSGTIAFNPLFAQTPAPSNTVTIIGGDNTFIVGNVACQIAGSVWIFPQNTSV